MDSTVKNYQTGFKDIWIRWPWPKGISRGKRDLCHACARVTERHTAS